MGVILLKNVTVKNVVSDLLIEGQHISRIAPAGTVGNVPAGTEVVECSGKVAMPGFINMHTHAGMAMMRGIGEDIAFH